ncbi:hypothetical protein GJ654_10940 [Rhodoblastus acidophilus]|uniref:Uncharacterized protein n=1 Tax=Rhodoblastus acidophilus TaxID=1074 RepID=A0A6N8DQQ8_RHOAC|nr:hypothetical protein [Rhodoblastus acidophilus]MCW2274905.1 putative amidohydrolase [Rhodoblastus acidophilus]MTV31511.1 hypothetical protein [Rhodoblastus acidophilus]
MSSGVTEVYGAIFSSDPLLLEEENQVAYGKALLKHLLLHRTISSCVPLQVDLHDSLSVEKFLATANHSTRKPEPSLIERYKQSRRGRTPLSPEDLKALREFTLVFDARQTQERHDPRFSGHEEAIESLKGKAQESQISQRLRIAVVGYRVGISKLPETGYFNEHLCLLGRHPQITLDGTGEPSRELRLSRTRGLGNAAEWENEVISGLELALRREPHIVVFPEFALPSESEESQSIERRIREVSERAQADHFIFAGSRHIGGANRGLILSRKGAAVSQAWPHLKTASARGLGENVLGPDTLKFPTYCASITIGETTTEFAIMVAICYDAFDPSMFLNLVLQCRLYSSSFPSIILVPSFNTSRHFVELLRDLSCVAKCVVVYVNGLHGDAKMFAFGYAILDLVGKESVVIDQLKNSAAIANKKKETLKARLKESSHADDIVTADRLRKEINLFDKKINAINLLRSSLADRIEAGSLTHLLTIERSGVAGEPLGYFRSDDIIYYNIDPGLVYDLQQFREYYYLGDSFLPEPFSAELIDQTLKEMQNRSSRRDA